MALSRVKTWVAGEVLTASDLNTEFSNMLNNALSMISPLTASLNAGGFKITNYGGTDAPSARSDVPIFSQMQDQAFTWCGTASGTANDIELTLSPAITAYAAGQVFKFKSGASANTGATTVAISGLATKAIQVNGAACVGGEISASQWYEIVYDGTAFQVTAVGSGIYQAAGTGSVARTEKSKLDETVSVKDFGAVSDGATNDTADIVTAATAHRMVTLPFNTLVSNWGTLLASLPTNSVLLDFSQINSFRAAGESTKEVGIISQDDDVTDTNWRVGSGHHAILQTNNLGTAGTTSATERKASWLWSCGYFAQGSTDKRGFRSAAIAQWTKATGQDWWQWGIRSLAPWESIGAEYERWQASTAYALNDYVVNGSNHYKCTVAGTSASSGGPVHTSGTASDGTVTWEWIDSADRTIFLVDQFGRVRTNGGSTGTFDFKQAATDPDSGVAVRYEAGKASGNVSLKLVPHDSGNTAVALPFLITEQSTSSLLIRNSGNTASLATITDSGGVAVQKFCVNHSVAADLDTTPSVSTVSTLFLSNTGATSITTLDDASNNQVVRLIATNGNTTLVHASTFMLTGSANLVMAAYDSVTMQRVPSSISARWIEVARSIK